MNKANVKLSPLLPSSPLGFAYLCNGIAILGTASNLAGSDPAAQRRAQRQSMNASKLREKLPVRKRVAVAHDQLQKRSTIFFMGQAMNRSKEVHSSRATQHFCQSMHLGTASGGQGPWIGLRTCAWFGGKHRWMPDT